MDNILLLTDFSDLSAYARSLADKVAFHTGATLHILKVVNVPSEIEIRNEDTLLGGMSDDVSALEQEKRESEAQIDAWTSELKATYVTKISFGRLQTCVKDYIQGQNIHLVVMGTHGVSGLKELISGSITEHLILKNDIPVLSLKCNRDNIDFSDFLITGDFDSAKESDDLLVLKELQRVFNSKMHLLWINTPKNFHSTTRALDKMKQFAQKNRLENTELHIYNDNSIEDGIVNFSNNYDAAHSLKLDIIAVEKKQKTELGYMITGCQATSFVNHIFRPLITYTNA